MSEDKQEIKTVNGYVQTIGAKCPYCSIVQVFFKDEKFKYNNFIKKCFHCKRKFKIGEIK